MTVKELKEKLEKLDPDFIVFVAMYNPYELTDPEPVEDIIINKNEVYITDY